MKKFYTLMLLVLSFPGAFTAMACHNSSFTLNSHTNLGGGLHEYQVTFCAGAGLYGAVGRTDKWAVMLGGNASFNSYPATLTSPLTGAVYGANNSIYGPTVVLYDVVYYSFGSSFSSPASWTCIDATCGPATSVCISFAIVTNGEPTSLTLMGAEADGVGVPPYGCNGNPEMTINLSGPVVEAGSNKNICKGSSVTLTGSATSGTPPYSYYWSNGATTATINVSPTQTTTYYLTVSDVNGLYSSDAVSVVVQAAPNANAGNDASILSGYGSGCVSLSASANGSTTPYSYSWSNGASGANPTVCPNATTTYTLTVTDANGCTATDNVTVNVTNISCGRNKVSMCRNGRNYCINTSQVNSKLNQGYTLGSCGSNKTDEVEYEELTEVLENKVDIYPNPANNTLYIKYSFNYDASVSADIFNVTGARVNTLFAGKQVYNGQENLETIDTQAYPAGVYFINITTSAGETIIQKLLINH